MIYCSDFRCKYCNDKNKCTNKNVNLSLMGINTLYQGYQHLLKCESFEEHPYGKKIREALARAEEMGKNE